jgi:hypothetical protein
MGDVLQFPEGYSEEQLVEELSQIFAETKKPVFEDPGPAGYDIPQENLVRQLMTLVADYAEEGPKFDPAGQYLCGTCQMRALPEACSHVTGKISMEIGSCEKYVIGPQSWPIQIVQWSQKEANYAERPEAKGFGCSRCGHGSPAKQPDEQGRSVWCDRFGTRVQYLACCAEEGGPDMVMAPGE